MCFYRNVGFTRGERKMKKYIRTKDGRIGKVTHEDNKNYRAKFGRKCPLISKDDVIKTADTIEELVDMFVIKNPKNGCLDIVSSLGVINVQLFKESGLVVYGAIWTDKGLIFVAKMNDKGVLELL